MTAACTHTRSFTHIHTYTVRKEAKPNGSQFRSSAGFMERARTDPAGARSVDRKLKLNGVGRGKQGRTSRYDERANGIFVSSGLGLENRSRK